ncbi:hypothetical protein [Ewingella americana]|uniref:hypothetical protein n=1 Tax=Ewingella americana TaxID=41202 RepID=UPI0012AD96C4|nr:hypothetical protein [Ewingella americana]MRT01905.1 hypothetical protein [Ewingella americana]
MKELKEFTVERLEQFAKTPEKYDHRYLDNQLTASEARSLAKIALAAKQAKPVAWITQPALEDNNGTAFVFMSEANLSGCIPFYTTPPLIHTEQHLDMVAPDGWKFVPIEPTPAMMVEGTLVSEFQADPAGMYRAMIAASPKPEM